MKTSTKIEILKAIINDNSNVNDELPIIDKMFDLTNEYNFYCRGLSKEIVEETWKNGSRGVKEELLYEYHDIFYNLSFEEKINWFSELRWSHKKIDFEKFLTKNFINFFVKEDNLDELLYDDDICNFIEKTFPLTDLHENFFYYDFIQEKLLKSDAETKKTIFNKLEERLVSDLIKKDTDIDFYLNNPDYIHDFGKYLTLGLKQNNIEVIKECLKYKYDDKIFEDCSNYCFKSNCFLFFKTMKSDNFFKCLVNFDDPELFIFVVKELNIDLFGREKIFIEKLIQEVNEKFLKKILGNVIDVNQLLKYYIDNPNSNISINFIESIVNNFDVDTTSLLFYLNQRFEDVCWNSFLYDLFCLLFRDPRTFFSPIYFKYHKSYHLKKFYPNLEFHINQELLDHFFKLKSLNETIFENVYGVPNRKPKKDDILIKLTSKKVYRIKSKIEFECLNDLTIQSFNLTSEFCSIDNPKLNEKIMNYLNISLINNYKALSEVISDIDSKIDFLKNYLKKFESKISYFEHFMNDSYFKNILFKNYEEICEKIKKFKTEIEDFIEQVEVEKFKDTFEITIETNEIANEISSESY